tara:strand:+ start:2301 stop:2534 length:234 start_codon:yes stop_codon:yes gene_type:complete
MMSKINFQELLQGVQDAQGFLEEKSGKSLEELIEIYYESLPFALGHMMGMRDCLTIVQQMLMGMMDPQIQKMKEEEE